jgi:hypothetical protein
VEIEIPFDQFPSPDEPWRRLQVAKGYTQGQESRGNTRVKSTYGYRINGKTTNALEGSIFVAGAAVQWMRNAMELI